MKQTEEKINKQQQTLKKKNKRQISIITVFLWLFLIATMTTIMLSTNQKKSALEVPNNDWNITLVMYDRSSTATKDVGITDFTWNPTWQGNSKELCMQVNYACTTGKEYKPGEIKITMLGFPSDCYSEMNRNRNRKISATVAADKSTEKNKQYDFSYTYDSESNVYTFTNNNTIELNEHFEGTIQIVYDLRPWFKIKTDLEFKAKIQENIADAEEIIAMESNVCNFHYTATKYIYGQEIAAATGNGAKADFTKIEDILDDYYWIRYWNRYTLEEKGVIEAYESDGLEQHLFGYSVSRSKVTLPEGCVVYDENLEVVEPKEGNTYYLVHTKYYYVGYPKTKYHEGDSVIYKAEIWGRYEDEEEIQKLAEGEISTKLVDFNFEYNGNLYGISKSSASTTIYFGQLKGDMENFLFQYRILPKVFYTGNKMDAEVGDDLLYITRKDGDVTRLTDEEYNFNSVTIPVFYTYNKYNGEGGDKLIGYSYDLQVRYKNTNKFVSYTTGITSEESITITFDREDIVGVKLVIKDLDKTLYSYSKLGKYGGTDYYGAIYVKIKIHTQDWQAGNIYNFSYLQVYTKDENGRRTLANEPGIESYDTFSTQKLIAEYDQSTYGTYMQRAHASDYIRDGSLKLQCRKRDNGFVNNVEEEKYEWSVGLTNRFDFTYFKVDKDFIIKTYDILPEGMYLTSTEEDIKNSIIGLSYSKIKLKSGTIFNTNEELNEYIREHTKVEIDYNYKDSGRTKISMITNLNEIDWSYYESHYESSSIYCYINTEIPYDSIQDYGTRYDNKLYSKWNNQEYEYVSRRWFGFR